jgi:hypothetical protein
VKSGVDVKYLAGYHSTEAFVQRSVVFILCIAYSPVAGGLFCLLQRQRSTTANTTLCSVDASDATCSLAAQTRS